MNTQPLPHVVATLLTMTHNHLVINKQYGVHGTLVALISRKKTLLSE